MRRLIFFTRQGKGMAWRKRTMAKNTTKIKELKIIDHWGFPRVLRLVGEE
jgi:hypothetical protein